MKLMIQKKHRFARILTALFSAAVTFAVCTVTAFAEEGGAAASEAVYQSTVGFFITWIRRIGMMVAFIGAIMFALAIKNNDSEQKLNGLITMVAGFVVAALCAASGMFNLFA